MSPEWLWLIAGALIVIGLIGVVVPGVPGVIAIFGGMLLAAWIDQFQRITALTLVLLGVLTALAFVADIIGGLLGAKRVGASRQALIGAVIGGIIGIFLGLPGLLLGPFIGAMAGEFIAQRRLDSAARVGFGTGVGLLIGTLAKVGLAFTMLGVFAAAWWID
jgi:uncharacterized protein YqgC (DUF456 family)